MLKTSPLQGAAYLLRGIRLLTVPGLRQFVLMPLLLSGFLYSMGSWYAFSRIREWSMGINAMLPSWLQWVEWVVIPLLFVLLGTTLFWTFGVMANLLGSPFNALLAEKVEHHLSISLHNQTPSTGLLGNIIPTLTSEINKIIYFLLRAIPLLLLFVVPVINIAAPLLWILFSCWMTAFQYADFPMSNHNMNDKQILAKLREKRLLTLGFGAATMLMTLIPFVNFLAMPAAVAGATAMWVEHWRD
ncbi:MAG: sulfate transporter CysZ [Magnetococcus sp. YQC-5]